MRQLDSRILSLLVLAQTPACSQAALVGSWSIVVTRCRFREVPAIINRFQTRSRWQQPGVLSVCSTLARGGSSVHPVICCPGTLLRPRWRVAEAAPAHAQTGAAVASAALSGGASLADVQPPALGESGPGCQKAGAAPPRTQQALEKRLLPVGRARSREYPSALCSKQHGRNIRRRVRRELPG